MNPIARQPKDVPAEAMSPLEESCRQAEDMAREHAALLKPLYTELARCDKKSGVPDSLRAETQQELAALRRASASLRSAMFKTEGMTDELSARLRDVQKATNRKWYRRNPPANSVIDLQEQEADHFAQGMNLYKLGLVLFIGSFAGVVVELIWCFIRLGYLESRSGVLFGPFNLLYGVGAVALSLMLYRYRNHGRWLSFLGGMAIGSVVEYVCSWAMEVVFGSRSWDYSDMPFNLNGRICLLYSVFWGVLGVIWIKDIYPRMAKWILKIPNSRGRALTWALVIFLALDGAISGLAVLRWSQRVDGVAPRNAYERLMDQCFPDAWMERVYANMTFD